MTAPAAPDPPPGPPRDHGPGVRVPPPVMVGGAVLAGWLLAQAAPLPVMPPQPGFGVTVILLGMLLAAFALVVQVRAGTDPRPDRPDRALVSAGPFRFTRNPIYLGFLLAAAGCALRLGDAWGWLAVLAAFLLLDRVVVAREEAYLRQRFGAAYAGYAARVRRWV